MCHRTGHIGGEVQAAGLHVAGHDQVQARFVNGDAPVFQDLDLAWVDVQAQHVVAHFGQTGPGHQAHIAGANNRNFHDGMLLSN